MTAGTVAVLVGVEVAIWAGRATAHYDLLTSNLLITVMAVFLGVGTAAYGSFKLGAANEDVVLRFALELPSRLGIELPLDTRDACRGAGQRS